MPEAKLERDEAGLAPAGDGWFILNATEGRWNAAEGMGACCFFEHGRQWTEMGFNVNVLQPGEYGGMYHAEGVQEGFFVLAGEGVAIVEGGERPLRQWDYFHCPPETPHILVATGDAPFVYVAFSPRRIGSSLVYPANEAAARHGASVDQDTSDPREAYASRKQAMMPYPGGLPDYASRSTR